MEKSPWSKGDRRARRRAWSCVPGCAEKGHAAPAALLCPAKDNGGLRAHEFQSHGSVSTDSMAPDRGRLARAFVYVDNHRVQLDMILGGLHAPRHGGEESLQDHVLLHA